MFYTGVLYGNWSRFTPGRRAMRWQQDGGKPQQTHALCRGRFGLFLVNKKIFRSRCAILTVFVVTIVFRRVSRSCIAFERAAAMDGVGRTRLVSHWRGNPDSLGSPKKITFIQVPATLDRMRSQINAKSCVCHASYVAWPVRS